MRPRDAPVRSARTARIARLAAWSAAMCRSSGRVEGASQRLPVGVARGDIDLRGAHDVPVHVRLHDHLGGGAELLPVQVVSREQQLHGGGVSQSQPAGEQGVQGSVAADQRLVPAVERHLGSHLSHYPGPVSGLLFGSSGPKVPAAHGSRGEVHLLHNGGGQCQDAHVARGEHHLLGHPAIGNDGRRCGHLCLLLCLHLGHLDGAAAHHPCDDLGRGLPHSHAHGRGPGLSSLLQRLRSVVRGHVHGECLPARTGYNLYFVCPEGELSIYSVNYILYTKIRD